MTVRSIPYALGAQCSCSMYKALSWFKEHFIKCSERAALVKTWLPVQYDGPKIYLDQLVYDRALLLVRVLIHILDLLTFIFHA